MIERYLAIQKLNTKMSISVKSNRALFDLDLLRAIVVVADCGSFTTAAARLHSTQSTVSQHIKVLLDAGLLVREARGTRNCYKLRADRLRAFGSATSGLFDSLIPDNSAPHELAEPA